jgi:hypothetical protein
MKIARPGIDRSVGARVVDRLQRLARNIFPALSGTPQGVPKGSRVVRGGNSHLDDDGSRLSERKGVRSQTRVNVKVNANWLRLAARSSIAPVEGVLGQNVHVALTR